MDFSKARFHSTSIAQACQKSTPPALAGSHLDIQWGKCLSKSLWLQVRALAQLSGATSNIFPFPPVQMSVDGVKHRHCVASKQAGPLHGVNHPLHRASHEGHKHRGVVGQQHQAPPQLSAMVDNQIDPLIMPCHLYKVELKGSKCWECLLLLKGPFFVF